MITKVKILFGKDVHKNAFGMTGCIHGMYCENVEHYLYGIKGIIGLYIKRRWGSDY